MTGIFMILSEDKRCKNGAILPWRSRLNGYSVSSSAPERRSRVIGWNPSTEKSLTLAPAKKLVRNFWMLAIVGEHLWITWQGERLSGLTSTRQESVLTRLQTFKSMIWHPKTGYKWGVFSWDGGWLELSGNKQQSSRRTKRNCTRSRPACSAAIVFV